MNCKNKSFMTKKAFTLIELLIVIAIIGILFIVLVSKVDFATDKAKATGVQTDFRSFQLAFDTVAKENAGFNTFGWDTGDTNGDRVRNSYDEGDANKDGVKDEGEVWTGRKAYAETWTGVYTLVKPGTTGLDAEVIFKLESAINKNLDPKLHITIDVATGKVAMANQAQDPWKNEYHGVYLSNAAADKKDRGAFIMYSNGANGEWGSEHSIANGVVTITVPGNNIKGQDDMSIVSCYTYVNGYGEVKNMTTGFSNNQGFMSNNGTSGSIVNNTQNTYSMLSGENATANKNNSSDLVFKSEAEYDKFSQVKIDGVVIDSSNYTVTEGSTIITLKKDFVSTLSIGHHVIEIVATDGVATASFSVEDGYWVPGIYDANGTLVLSWNQIEYNNFSLTNNSTFLINRLRSLGYDTFEFDKLVIPEGTTTITGRFSGVTFRELVLPETLVEIGYYCFSELTVDVINIPSSVKTIGEKAFYKAKIGNIVLPENLTTIGNFAFYQSTISGQLIIPGTVSSIGDSAFSGCTNLTSVIIKEGVTDVPSCFTDCTSLTYLELPNSLKTLDRVIRCTSLTEIIYNGTLAEWNLVDVSTTTFSPVQDVICTDGQTKMPYESTWDENPF